MWNQVHQALHQSIQRTLFKLVTLLPGILAFVLAVLIAILIGWMLVAVLRRIFLATRFDERLGKWGIANVSDWSPSNSPTMLVTRIVFWVTVIIGVFVGVAAFDASSAYGISAYLITYVSKVIAAIIVMLVGVIVARFLARSVLIGAVNMNLQYARLLSVGAKWLVLVFAAAMALDHLAIGGAIVDLGFGIVFGGIVLALALAVGLGSRDLVSRSLERETQKSAAEEETVRHF